MGARISNRKATVHKALLRDNANLILSVENQLRLPTSPSEGLSINRVEALLGTNTFVNNLLDIKQIYLKGIETNLRDLLKKLHRILKFSKPGKDS